MVERAFPVPGGAGRPGLGKMAAAAASGWGGLGRAWVFSGWALGLCSLLASGTRPAAATTHWVVTEDGKIQQQVRLGVGGGREPRRWGSSCPRRPSSQPEPLPASPRRGEQRELSGRQLPYCLLPHGRCQPPSPVSSGSGSLDAIGAVGLVNECAISRSTAPPRPLFASSGSRTLKWHRGSWMQGCTLASFSSCRSIRRALFWCWAVPHARWECLGFMLEFCHTGCDLLFICCSVRCALVVNVTAAAVLGWSGRQSLQKPMPPSFFYQQ